MFVRSTLLALSLVAGTGMLVAAPAEAGHDRATIVYRSGDHHDRDYRHHSRYRDRGHHRHYGKHWRSERRHFGHKRHYGHHKWKHKRRYHGHGHRRHDSGYRIWFEYRN